MPVVPDHIANQKNLPASAKPKDGQWEFSNSTFLDMMGAKPVFSRLTGLPEDKGWRYSNTDTLNMLNQLGVCQAPDPSRPAQLPLPPPPKSPTLTGDIKAGIDSLLVKAGLKDEPPKIKYAAVMTAAPPPTLWGEIKSGYYEANTPLQVVEKVTGRAVDHSIRSVRGILPAAADISLRDTFAQAGGMIADANPFHWVMDGNRAKLRFGWGFGKSGDDRPSPEVEKSVERAIDRTRPYEHGDYDIRMAAGWKPEGPVKYNGKMVTLDNPVSNMLAVYIRDQKGNIEILDPSTKVESLGQLRRLPAAITQMPWNKESDIDKRWREHAGTYVWTQIIPLVATGGTAGVVKGGSLAGTKIPQIARAAEALDHVSKAAKSTMIYRGAIAPWGAVTGVTGISTMGDMLSQNFYFTPEAIREISDGIAKALTDPKGITAKGMRDNLNEALSGYSFREGSNSGQIYVPSLKNNQEPWARMQQSLHGIIEAHQKSNNPWQEWSSVKRVDVGELREALSSNPAIQHTFYTSVEKALSGKPLTDQDVFVMRVGFNLGDWGGKNLNVVGAAGLKFTEAERKETVEAVTSQLGRRVATKVFDVDSDDPAVKKRGEEFNRKHGIKADDINPGDPQFTPAQLKSFVSGEITTNANILNAQRQAELEKMRAMSMAMAMH